MWFKNGLKAQKLLAQGSALGYYDRKTCRPVRAKAFKYQACNKAFALTGRRAKCCLYPGRCPGLGASALSGRAGKSSHKPLPILPYFSIFRQNYGK